MRFARRSVLSVLAVAITAWSCAVPATVITVTTTNNLNPGAGNVSLLQALGQLHDGDTVRFNISGQGQGPFYIATPPNGYPIITNNNITIDGYSQPGSAPNSNPILGTNNARLKIVLDSRNGNDTSMNFEPDNSNSGYGPDEHAVLGFLRGSNAVIQGLCFLGKVPSAGDHSRYFVSFACDAQGSPTGSRVSGCWLGLDPDGVTRSGSAYAITAFRYRDSSGGNPVLIDNLIIGVEPKAANAPNQFNVIVQSAIPIIIEGNAARISGNFLGVMPDGLHDYNVAYDPAYSGDFQFEGAIEIGRGGNNTLIGTDGDGVNDANERNVIGGTVPPALNGYDHTIEFYGNNPGTNIVIAGNYIGVGVDGSTYFTNGVPAINASGGGAQYRIGSNLDGISDDVEGNHIANNWPLDLFPATEWTAAPDNLNFFDELSTGATVSLRGNSLVNNFPFPVSPTKSDGGVPGGFRTNYYTKALVDASRGIQPILLTNTSISRLVGSLPLADTNNWPTTVIDLYAADPVGISNGQAAYIAELPNGFVQGAAYVASYVDNGANDRDKRLGFFDYDISTLDTKGSQVTVTANYINTNPAIVLTSAFSDPAAVTFIPGSIESVGLRRVVPDTPIIVPSADALGNWEPYVSVLGSSTFLIEGNTFATNDAADQQYVVYLQPATGGAGRLGAGFFSDNGKPFLSQINLSRQNGNPGRVGGDRRPGATNFVTAAETSAGQIADFQSDSRWTSNLIYQADNRYVTVQPFSVDPITLAQTPLHKAFDAVYGNYVDPSTTPSGGNQVSRTGGTVVGLDNGNFAVVIDDKTSFSSTQGEVTTASIITPTGAMVKNHFLVAPQDIWDNVASYQGGFCVRVHNNLYFYDNAGNLKGQVDQSTSGESYDSGRGDGTRIAAHINSPYVYLIGKVATANIVRVSVWDARDQSFKAKADVSEGAFTGGFDRANIAVDALNRFVAAWVSQPAGYAQQQVAARIMAYDPGQNAITALTKSFLPFINNGSNDIRTLQMSVAITTRQVLVAAKGEINLQNNPSAGPNSPREINFFTVFTHPNPKDDPTTPVGGAVVGAPALSIALSGNNVVISWPVSATGFGLQSTDSLAPANWSNLTPAPPVVVNGNSNTATIAVGSGSKFYRLTR